jgi:predicted site-specific integrase-resolvase
LSSKTNDLHKEDDLLAIVMVFAARIYGKRASAVRRKVKAVLSEEPHEAAA